MDRFINLICLTLNCNLNLVNFTIKYFKKYGIVVLNMFLLWPNYVFYFLFVGLRTFLLNIFEWRVK